MKYFKIDSYPFSHAIPNGVSEVKLVSNTPLSLNIMCTFSLFLLTKSFFFLNLTGINEFFYENQILH